MTTTEKRSAEDMLSEALSAMRQAYYQHVRDLAEDIDQFAREDKERSREDVLECLHETIDGDRWVIYTHLAQSVCLSSSNDGAAIDNYGTDGIVEDGAINWSRLAFSALEADVLDALDIDINADFPGRGEDDEEPDA